MDRYKDRRLPQTRTLPLFPDIRWKRRTWYDMIPLDVDRG